MWGTLMARALVPFGIMVVIPDYRNFPQTNVEGMIDDCDRAVEWTLQNIRTYCFACLRVFFVFSFGSLLSDGMWTCFWT